MKDLLYDIVSSAALPENFEFCQGLQAIVDDILGNNVPAVIDQHVFSIKPGTNYYSKALVTSVNGSSCTVKFADETINSLELNEVLLHILEWTDLAELNYPGDILKFTEVSDEKIIEFSITAHSKLFNMEDNKLKYKALYNILVIASLSFYRMLKSPGYQSFKMTSNWLRSDIFYIIDNFFNEPVFPIHKKLALDFAVVVITDTLNFQDKVLGFSPPLRKKDYFILKVTMKLLESFCVSTPTHYPFMPEPFFEGVQWPMIKESCPGKVHSLFVFSKSNSDGQSALTPAELSHFCQCEYVYRRQPWVHYFSSSQLLALGKVVIDTHNYDCIFTETGFNALMDRQYCQKILNLLRNVFRRIVDIDTSLIHRDKSKPCEFQMLSECSICYCKVAPFIRRYNIFSQSSSSSSKSFSAVSKASFASFPSSGNYREGNTTSPSVIAESSEHNLANTFAGPGDLSNGNGRELNHSQSIKVSGAASSNRQFPRHHCRLCFQTICDSCTSPDNWMSERICSSCVTILHAVDLMPASSVTSSGKKTSNITVVEGGGKQNRTYKKSSKGIKSPGPDLKDPKEASVSRSKKFKWFLFGKSEETVCNDLLDETDLCCSLILADELIQWRDMHYSNMHNANNSISGVNNSNNSDVSDN
jgi:hypothetical protein